jgi:CMP/dCMP kinase
MSIVIAVDGTAASGKGTLAKKLARGFGFAHLDSGKLYRLVAWDVIRAGRDVTHEENALAAAKVIDHVWLNDAQLLLPQVSQGASIIATFPSVRAQLLQFQRQFAQVPPGGVGAVIDGRDIGTVVCPDAQAKLFVDATPEMRAHRRWQELDRQWVKGPGNPPTPSEASVLAEIIARDARDKGRAIAPLKPAPDAALLDTTHLDIDAAFAAALALVTPKIEALKARPRG